LCTENPLTKWIERKSSRTHDEHEEQSGYQAPHGRSTKCKIAQPKNILNPPIDGSPKLLGVLRRNFGEMMSTVKAKIYPQTFKPLTSYNSWNRKSRASTSRTQRTRKPPNSKAFLWDLRGKITKKRGTLNLTKKRLQKLLTKIPIKSSENHQKRENERNNK
jgi:hypothetical protein